MKYFAKSIVPLFILGVSVALLLSGCGQKQNEDGRMENLVSSSARVEWTRDKCGNRQYGFKSDVTVDALVDNAIHYARNGKTAIPVKHFFYIHLDYPSLVELHARLYFHRYEGDLLTKLTFDLRDYMIRLAVNDSGAAAFFKANVLVDKAQFQNLDPDRSEFNLLAQSSTCPMGKLNAAQIFPQGGSFAPLANAKLRVFHGAMEAHNVRWGGVASFLAGLVQAENKHIDEHGRRDIEGTLVTPFYDVLKRKFFDTAEYVGFVDHEIDQMRVRSNVYKVREQGIEQYLIQADQGYRTGLYDIGEAAHLYKNFGDESWIYYSTALASFSALFRGATHDQTVDVLQINDWHLGMTSALLSTELNQKGGSRIASGCDRRDDP